MPTSTDPLDQLAAAEATGPAHYVSAPAVAANNAQYDPLDALAAQEANDEQGLHQLVGEHKVAQEQDAFATQLRPQTDPVQLAQHSAASDVLHDVGNRALDIIRGAEAGPIHAFGELEATVAELAGAPDYADQIRYGLSHGEYDYASNTAGTREQTVGGSAAQGITQFLTYFVPATAGLKLAGIGGTLARIGGAAGASGLTQAAAFNPHDARLSNLIQTVPSLQNPVTDFLQSKPGDSAAEGAFKNFIEGTAAGGLTDSAVEGFTAVLRGMRATNGIADAIKATDAAAPTPVSSVEVHEGEMTDEQRQLFGLSAQADLGTAGQRSGATGEGTQAVPGTAGLGSSTQAPASVTVYRGAPRPLTDEDFDLANQGFNSAHDDGTLHPSSGLGVYFTADAEDAARYGNVTQHQLYLQNPKEFDAGDLPGFDSLDDARAYQHQLIAEGHDGAVVRNSQVGGHDWYVAFDKKALSAPEAFASNAGQARPEVTPVVRAQAAGYEPPAIRNADSANPQGTASDPAAFDAKATVDAEAQRLSMSIPPERQAQLLQALRDGKYADVSGFLDDTHRTIPWDTLSDGANLKELFNATEATMGDLIKVAHGTGTVSTDTIAQLAKDLGGNVQNVAKLYGDTTAQGGLAARITAGYNIMVASARQLKELAAKANVFTPESAEGKQAILDFQKQLELHAAIVGQVRQSSSEIGRALYAHRALKASSDVALSNISELTGTVLGPKAVKQFLSSVADGKDLAAINAAADKARGGGLMGIIKEIAQNGMLSGIPTQLANITGNAVNLTVKQVERYLAGVIGNVRGVLIPSAETATVRQAVAHTVGAIAGVRDSFPLMVRALTTEQAVSASGRPLVRAIYKDTEGLAGSELTLAQLYNRVGQVVRYPGRIMGAIDNLNMGIGRQADLNARAYLQSATEADAKGLTGDARDAFLDSRMAELRTDPTLQAKAGEAGLYQSFQEPARTRFGEGVSSLLNSHPLVKLIIAPFVHRPLNMLRQSLSDYTLLGMLSKTQRETLSAGNADTDVALARMVLGTGALLTSYEMASNGQTTGARLGSRNTESLDEIPQHSIKIGDRYFRYDRVDPIGMWLGVGAELHEAVQRHYDPSNPDATSDLATMARAALQVVGQSAMEKSFMASADQVLKSLSERDPVKADVLAQRLVASNVGKFVPFSGALRGAAQALDTTERSTAGDGWAGIWDSVKANLPTLSQDLTPKRDVLGRPVERPAGDTAWWNPFGGSKASSDPLDQELSKVAVNITMPARTLDNLTLSPRDYDEVITTATKSPIFQGMNLENYLRQLTESEGWKQLESTKDHGVMARTEYVQQVVDAAYNYGKQSFEQSHPQFRAAMAQKMMQRAGAFTVPATVQ